MIRIALIRKIKLRYYLLIAILICLFFSSCSEVKMVDSSADPSYSTVIGKKFKLREDLLALGISSSNRHPADYVEIVPRPGFAGPEVVSRRTLKKDTVVQVTRALTSQSLIVNRVEYVVTEVYSSQLVGEEIRIRLVGNKDDATFGLDGNFYEIVH
jgi:hypothetical protein